MDDHGCEKSFEVSERDTVYTVDKPYIAAIKLYRKAMAIAPYSVDKIKAFRDKNFHGLDRVLWLVGAEREIDLCDIYEHDIDGRIR